jgi:KDO2-lipid IV(A) lauroyltransferase
MAVDKHQSVPFRARDYLHPKYWGMWLVIGLLRLAALLPYRVQLRLGAWLGRMMNRLSGKRRRIVDTNLRLCFPDKSEAERNEIRDRCFENLGISLMEMAICWWWPDERIRPLIEVRGLEHIEACQAEGRGVILLSGHFTSLEIGGRLLVQYIDMQAMYRTQRNRLFDSLLYTKRKGYLADIISRKNTLKLLKGIRRGIPTWYAPDQDFRRERNVFAPFFGVPTATITASSRLAKSAKAAMLPYFPERKADGSGYILHILPPLENFPSDDDLADATAINASIEQFVRRHPDQYMWVHQRFKTRPPGEDRIY